MSNTTYNIRIDRDVREQADSLFKSMGLSLSSAINLFLKQTILHGKLPIYDVIAEPYYADDFTVEASASRILSKHMKAFEELAK